MTTTQTFNKGRRDFLKISAATAAMVAGQGSLFGKTQVMSIENGKENYPNASYTETMYRNEFTYTYGKKQEHGFAFHCVNCQGNCAWEVWSHNGVVTRENQSARYPIVNPKIPDFNPRGCNKGAQHSQVMYEKDRILYPMKRSGKRGEGEWKKISWDEAATDVAQTIWDTLVDPQRGPSKLLVQAGTGLVSEARRAAPVRFGTQLGATRIYPSSYLGDMFTGATVAYGQNNVGCTWDFMYEVDTAVFWGANPSVSRMPDAHFVWEGKYNGAKVIVITPEYNASAKSADLWLPIIPGTDNILAMGIIKEILDQKLYKSEFVKYYTDLVFLVDVQTKQLLRRSEVENDFANSKKAQEFYCMNKLTEQIALMPATQGSDHKSLYLQDFDIDPFLEGEWEIEVGGKRKKVTTAFEMLKANSQQFTSEYVAKECFKGVNGSVIRQLARDIAIPKIVQITAGASLNKYFNGLLSVWNIASICGLTGRMGPFGGLNTQGEWNLSGLEVLSGFDGKYNPRFGSGFVSEFLMGNGLQTVQEYFSQEDVRRAHESNGNNANIGKQTYIQLVQELLSNGDMSHEKKGMGHRWWDPDVAIVVADSRFGRNKGSKYQEAFLQKMKYFCVVDYKMSDTAVWADLLLPTKSDYEVWDLKTSSGFHRYTNLAQPIANLKSIGEAKDEWEIFTLIANKLEIIANKPENISKAKVPDDTRYARDGFRDLSIFYQEFTNTDKESKYNLEPELGTDKMAVEAALQRCEQYQPHTIEKMYKQGGFLQINEKAATSSTLYSHKPYNTMENHIFKFERLQTLSGRQTFYVDHPMFIRLGAHTNTGLKNMRPDNKKYPLNLITPHARWSIQSSYKSSRTLLRLQRGVPYVAINKKLAHIKGIKDGDDIKVFNQLGSFIAMAKVSSSVPFDSLVMEDGWQSHMFQGLKGNNESTPMALNLLEMANGWGHLNFGALWDGNQYAYDGAINVQKVQKGNL